MAKRLSKFGQAATIGRFGTFGRRPIASRDLRHSEGIPVEIKCEGTLCVAPPSKNPQKGDYSFIEGGLDDLGRLPEINLSSLTVPDTRTAEGRSINVGLRNIALFRQCLREAPHCDDLETLIDCAQSFADDYFVEPLRDAEIVKAAQSAWQMQAEGRNWVGSEGRVAIPKSFIKQIAADIDNKWSGNAGMLLFLLLAEHAARHARGEPFMLVYDAMARDQCLPGWTLHQYKHAAKALLDARYIEWSDVASAKATPASIA